MLARLRTRFEQRFVAWALRRHVPETLPLVLGHRRIYVLPTRAGLAYAIGLGVMLIAAINYNLGLGYGLVFLLAALGIISILHCFRNILGLEIATARTEPVFAGEMAQFGLTLINRRPAERLGLQLQLHGSARRRFDLSESSCTPVQLAVQTHKRGWFAMPGLRLETTFPLGLVRAWSYCALPQRCLVYPRPAEMVPPLPQGQGKGQERPGPGEDADDFYGLRTYQIGDPLRQVAWKAVARTDAENWLSKQFATQTALETWLDWQRVPASEVETRLAILTRWALDADAAGISWGLRMPGHEIQPALGKAHLQHCLECLALYGQD